MRGSSAHLRSLAATALLVFGIGGLAAPAFGQVFIPSETPATANKRLLDPEFNMGKGLFTWVDIVDGSIWVGSINKATGEFSPPDGKGVLIEKNAAPPGGLGFTLNGPEWVLGADGDTVVYTRMPAGLPPTPANAQLGASFLNRNGKWVVRTIGGRPLNAPYGSDDPSDPAPRITYNDALGNHYWRELKDESTEELVPGLGQGLLPAVRHVRGEGERAIVYPVTVDGIPQVHWYQLDSKVLEQITTDPGKKEQMWMWRAPDFGNNRVMLTVTDESELALYEQAAGGSGTAAWTKVRSMAAPLGGRFFSTEPFVYGGKSYVVLQVIVGSYPNSIWLADFDATTPMLRRLTPETPDRARADPEVFFSDAGPIVFFSRFNQNRGTYWLCTLCAEGLYRAETGIPVSPTGR